MNIVIRKTNPIDLKNVLNAEQDPSNSKFVYQWSELEHLDSLSNPDIRHYVVADKDDCFLGYIILDDILNRSNSINLRRIVITKKSMGVGRTALNMIKEIVFEEFGAHRLWLDVFTDNLRAFELYKSVGFNLEGKLVESYLRDNIYVSQYIMAIVK